MYVKWDKKSKINGIAASDFLNSMPFFMQHDTLYLKHDERGNVREVQAKSVLAKMYSIDATLTDAEFALTINKKLEN